MTLRTLFACLAIFCSIRISQSTALAAEPIRLNKGDHITIIGNALAERMVHDGTLEALLYAAHPEHDLVIRNLGYSGDEICGYTSKPDPNKRLRSMDYGTADQWLQADAPIPQPEKLKPGAPVKQNRFETIGTRPDVIIALFGYNESFTGEAGLPAFKATLTDFIKHVTTTKYNGKAPPKLLLCSPIAHEDLGDPHLSDGKANNARLKLYTEAMKEVAKKEGVRCVELFDSKDNKTVNGIHLNAKGEHQVAREILAQGFDTHILIRNSRLRDFLELVRDKNHHWFQRYRATDGYSVYGDRAFLKFTGGQSNYEVGQRELEVLDQMVINREKAIWAVARGDKNAKPVDDNLPPFFAVESNKKGKLPGGKHAFLGGEEAIAKMTVHKDMKVNLFASEEQFPELASPVQMAFDTKGRLWVAAWPTYPHWKPTEPMNDKLLIFEDVDNDGRADICKTFAGDLHNPTGFEFWNGGVLVAQGPDVLFLKDTDGDDKYDVKERVLHGLDTADTHHTANSFTLDPGGALYFQEGTFHHSQIETPWGPPRRVANGAVFRYEPRTNKIDVHVSYGFANPHGHAFDRWGQDIVVDGTGAVPYHGTLFSNAMEFPRKNGGVPTVYQQRTRPCSGLEYLSGDHFGKELQGTLLVPNVIGFQGILNYKIEDESSSFKGTELEPIVYSSDANFRPADVETGPDGAIYFVDWHNPIIGHMQHNLRDPNRNREKGRVYRVTHKTNALTTPVKVAGEPIETLLDLLKSDDDRLRHRVRIELSGRTWRDLCVPLDAWRTSLLKHGDAAPHDLLEALWVYQQHNHIPPKLLEIVLKSSEPRARAAAVKVLWAWRDRVPNTLELLLTAAGDAHPRVRLEAIRAAGYLTDPAAYEVLLVAGELPHDPYLDAVFRETTKTLLPQYRAAIHDKKSVPFRTPAGARFLYRDLTLAELLKMPGEPLIWNELLSRPGVSDTIRAASARNAALLEQRNETTVVMRAIRALDAREGAVEQSTVFDLVRLLTSRKAEELAAARGELEMLAKTAKQPLFRQIAIVSLLAADKSIDKVAALVEGADRKLLLDLLNAMPLIADPVLREALYPKINDVLVATALPGTAPRSGRFVRIELPDRGTLTLAEVEVFDGDRNVARSGKATQTNTDFGGDAARAIDGKTEGAYDAGTSTHTAEQTPGAFWEVDLGSDHAIDRIAIYGRTDGEFYKRMQGFTVSILDANRNEVWKAANNPAPRISAEFKPSGDVTARSLRHAAFMALTTVRGKESDVFAKLADWTKQPVDRAAAIRALQRLPRATWPRESAAPLVARLLADLRTATPAERARDDGLNLLEFAGELAGLLPTEQARATRAELDELGVRVVKLNTVFEKMAYDKETLVVRAGKPVEFLLENSDLMPHNFVIVELGALEEIGLLSESQAQDPKFAAANYVPNSPKVLTKSGLMQPRATTRVSFVAPTKPGVYPYVCTYPGHWRRMYGALYVVADLNAYDSAPEAYLTAAKIAPLDVLLNDRRSRTEWKFSDLAPAVAALPETGGRSRVGGVAAFKTANCGACHKLDDAGREFGPDLTKLNAQDQPVDVLRHVLEPSARIDDKYRTFAYELTDGRTITGMEVEQTKDAYRVIENPLAKAEPIELLKSVVAERQALSISPMPKGLLEKLSRDEVLDLMALLIARGQAEHAVFKKMDHEHGAHKH